ncbi:hypothetical protein EC973_007342 [Apophysomyces ossiformis]|uniref:Methionine synthase reductase n=1 Tax=Apophysomyces ossiformis TaxID=679940 RepID=A0A8H7BXW7_9FUNG|nr:hypothetical protein EC973_007342 [Apophysomyces ossiformis]
MAELASSYLILWASQTGNAEWIAKNIHSEAKRRGYQGECLVMDDYEKAPIDKAGVIIFVTSNTGDGDPPDNALKFWRFLRRQKQPDYLAHARVTILGLGDTNYSNFNNTGKRLERKVKELGATIFYPKGLADDAEGLELVVDPWIEKLWEVLPTVLSSDEELAKAAATEAEVEVVVEKTEDLTLEPYSMKARKRTLPENVEKYVDLPNSLVDKYSIEDRTNSLPPPVENYTDLPNSTLVNKQGHPLVIDLSGLEAGAKLTALPKVPAAAAQLGRVGPAKQNTAATVPHFVTVPGKLIYAGISKVRCLTTQDAVKRTLHLELDAGEEVTFEPGDAFGVIAPNDESLVEAILARLTTFEEGYKTLFDVQGESLPSHLANAKSVTLLDLLRYGVDLTSSPRKALFRLLADYTSDAKEKTTLMYICSKQGASQFNAIRDQVPTLLDILATFPSCKPPIERLLDVLPPHMPRYYSIANSPLKSPGKIHFAFNIVDYTTEYDVPRKGVATPWLDHLTGVIPHKVDKPTTVEFASRSIQVPIFLRQNVNSFVLPAETRRPMVLIGPGTGIAPFIGFVEHRHEQRRIRKMMGGVGTHPSRDIEKEFGDIWVYYGFRERNKDYLFEEELETFAKDGTIKKLALAVSRGTEKKTYVQDLLRTDAKELYDLIVNKDAAIYVCGDAKGMAKGVQDVLVDMLCEYGQLDKLEANKRLIEWMGNHKYLRDLIPD